MGMLEAMYKDDTVAIDVNGSVGGFIGLNRGVKQGKLYKSNTKDMSLRNMGTMVRGQYGDGNVLLV